jgi:hypothetical protein
MTALASLVRRASLAASVVCIAAALPAAEPAVIAKARSYLGSEAALNGVKSVHYIGTLVTNDPANPGKETRAKMEIIFQKPEQQRIVATSETTVETTALDGYEGWTRVQAIGDAGKWRQTLLGSEQIKRLRANTWENLGFFRGIERIGGRVEEHGTQSIDGVTCQKLAFIHGPKIAFYRYFDPATGRLVMTETEGGGTIREKGEMTVEGVRFPKSIITTSKNAKGQMVTVTIEFEKITVNEVFPAKLFAVPGMSNR